jgi:membrane-associated phospholipid phosphatase
MAWLTNMLGNWDRDLLLSLNSFAGSNTRWIWSLANNDLFRGVPIFLFLTGLWFSSDCEKRRGRMLAGLLATCLATMLSVWLQFHLAFHIRPLLDPLLPLDVVDPAWRASWDRPYSFPSDNATLFFSLATVIFLENRLIGLLCFLWTMGVIALPRVIFGWHFPSDILGSLVLGPAGVLLFGNNPFLRAAAERALTLFERHMHVVHALLFIFLAETYNLFRSVEAAAKSLMKIVHP